MTMHVILGDGEMTSKELTATLHDLWDAANNEGQTFWFLVQAKPEPTETDQNLMKFLATNEVYYEVIGDGSDVPDIYNGAQETHTVKRLAPKIVSLMQSKPEENEPADLLALFVSDDPEAEEDRWVNDVVQQVLDEEFKVYALNDGLVEIDMSEEELEQTEEEAAEAEAEAEAAPAPVKAAAKKAAAAPKPKAEPLTRDALEDMTLDQLKEVASNLGISLPPRTRAQTYVDTILGEGKATPEAEVAEPEEQVMITGAALSGVMSAMVIVIYNGTITSKVVTPEEAQAILA